MVTFSLGKGMLYGSDGSPIGPAYSGAPGHVDVASDDMLKALGPIPLGLWRIGPPVDLPKLGPFCLPLLPCDGTDTLGRGGFFFHGDNVEHNQTGSEGCVVAGPLERRQVWQDPDHLVSVVP
jgi:hypothetical protein